MNAVLPHQFRRNSDSMHRVSVPALGVVAYAPDDVQAVKALRFYSQKYPAQVVRIEPVHGFQFSPVEPHQSTVAPGDEPGPRTRPGAGLTDRNEGSEQ